VTEQLAQYLSVEDQKARLIPVKKEPCTLSLTMRYLVNVDCSDPADCEEKLANLRRQLQAPEPAPEEIECPYPGLKPYSEKTAYFFGREREIDELELLVESQRR